MTSVHLVVVEPSDIRGLRVECRKCQAAVSLRLDQTIRLPQSCPSCNAVWFDNLHPAIRDTFEELAHALKTWSRAEQDLKPLTFRVGFELPGQSGPRG
jgi:hypothetical protein